jgi:alkaline phosphatase
VFSGAFDKGKRPAPLAEEATDPAYRQQALIPSYSETHGGQDVTIYASGPRAHLFGGVVEQNYIFHVMADALNLGAD